jgi:hypothetical protein
MDSASLTTAFGVVSGRFRLATDRLSNGHVEKSSQATKNFGYSIADDRDERRPLSVLVSLDWSGRIETEQENDKGKDDWRYAHGFLHHRKKIARTRKPSRTPSNGLDTANQKETFQSEVVEFIFTLFSQAFEDRHFTKI